MKAIKTLLAASALATIAGAANATVWNVEMSANVFFPAASGPLQMVGFTGTYDDVANAGTWTGTTTIPGFATTLHYTQTFTMNETSGAGKLNAFNPATCTDNTGSGCAGLGPALSGPLFNNPLGANTEAGYKTKQAFVPADGWVGQWTLQVNKSNTDPDTGEVTTQYIPLPLNVTLHSQAPAVPVPAAAWLFGSGLLGLAGTARRRRS